MDAFDRFEAEYVAALFAEIRKRLQGAHTVMPDTMQAAIEAKRNLERSLFEQIQAFERQHRVEVISLHLGRIAYQLTAVEREQRLLTGVSAEVRL